LEITQFLLDLQSLQLMRAECSLRIHVTAIETCFLDTNVFLHCVNKAGTALSGRALNRHSAWAAIRKRARNAGFLTPVGCHTWRATGVTVYLENGGRLEHAQQMAAHESPRSTKLYDRTKDEITIGEVERIQL
jgi:integrase